MKKLLTILLLLPLLSVGQGFSFSSASRGFFNTQTLTIGSGTYTAGTTYLIFLGTTRSGATPTDNPTVSSGTLTLTKRGTATGTDSRIIAYTFTPASTTTTAISFTYAEAQLVHIYAIYSAASLVGFENINTISAGGTGADPLLTLPSTGTSCTVGFFLNNRNPFTGTAEAGWTEGTDNGISTTGYASYNRNVTSDNTLTVTSASATWTGLGIQFTNRRVFTIH
jgi:hypothetical protein